MSRAIVVSSFLLVLALGGAAFVAASTPGHHMNSDEGPLASMTGAPAIGSLPAENDCTFCHQDFDHPCEPVPCNLNAGGGGITLIGLPPSYVPNQVIPLRVRIESTANLADPDPLWGFQLVAVRATDGASAGTFEPYDAETLQVMPGSYPFASRQYLEQTFAGARLGLHGAVEWSFDWRAPADDAGDILFYFAGNASNGNDEPGAGDWIYTANAITRSGVTPTHAVRWGTLKARYR